MTLYSCSYQTPIPADQVRPAAEFDQDAGVLLLARKLVLHLPYFCLCIMNLLYFNSAEAIPSGRGRGRGRRGRGIYLLG
jgi:ribonucleases P/MRP protein subunit RPP25